jgi:lipoate-protein ligase A
VAGPAAAPVVRRACAEILRDDERALRAAAPRVRVSVVADAALSCGVGVRGAPEYVARARSTGLALVRRSSGGTGVVHAPGDLVWSVVLPRSDPRVGRDFNRAYARLGRGLVRFLEANGVAGSWTAPPGVSDGCCVLGHRGEVLAVGARVLGGAAQHVTRDALLHQGMVPLAVDRALARRLFALDPADADRLVGLGDLGIVGDPEALAARLADALVSGLGSDRTR